uniref:DNA polymerase epsilon subunit 4 n=1 Tax=Hucho hucho TaxID=62062 RepID=A0A4W5Q5Z7_9TELE
TKDLFGHGSSQSSPHEVGHSTNHTQGIVGGSGRGGTFECIIHESELVSDPEQCEGEEELQGIEAEEENNQHTGPVASPSQNRLAKLPLSRIKALMKADSDVSLASQESVFIIAKATELFVEMIAKDALVYAQQGKRKTLQRKDLDNAIDAIDEFAFLEGTLDA